MNATNEAQAAPNDYPGADRKATALFCNAMQALQAAAPPGSTVRAVGFDRTDMFLRAGYRVTEGDADVTIARGGEREFAQARRTACRRLVLCPTHAFCAAATDTYRARDGAFAFMAKGDKPFAAAIDERDMDQNLASSFGELLALDLCAFDLNFGALMRGERLDNGLVTRVAALLSELTSTLRAVEKDRPAICSALADAGKRAARIVEERPELLHASGAAQCAEALRMLYAEEDRSIGMRGETVAAVTPYITDFYIKCLSTDAPEFPPDNNRRIDSVCEYFGADLRRACVYATAVYPPIKMRLCEYRRNEFRAEQIKRLTELKSRELPAMQVFKRLYPDDGYGLRTLVDKTDIPICMALAPDVFCADTMLSFIKQTGRLEKYIV